MSDRVFTSLTHGLSPDCRLANAQLKETLESYNFGAFLVEKSCSRCPNDDCNISFMLILQTREFMRLKRQVSFPVRPTFLVHRSFSELIEADHRIRRSLLADNSIGIQVGAEMQSKLVDACPPVHNIQSQTDFMMCRRDWGDQTDCLNRQDAMCQVEPEPMAPPVLSFSNVNSLNVNNNNNKNNSSSSTIEVQIDSSDDDDEVVILEFRQATPRVEVKQEAEAEEPGPIITLIRAQEIKTEVFEPEPEEQEPMDLEDPEEPEHPIKQEQEEEEEDVSSTPPSMIFSPISSAFSSLSTDSFYTPRESSEISANNTTSSSTPGGSAAKRVKYSDIEICQRCLDVTYFEKMEEYVGHILESHVSISRFKCTVCDRKFGTSVAARHHISSRCHESQTDSAEFVPEVSEDSIHKFLTTANACYTDKFRNIQPEEIAEIIKNLP